MADTDTIHWAATIVDWLSKVVASAAIVLGALWRWLTHVITQKIKEEIEIAMRAITETTSKAIDALRHEVRGSERRAEERSERLADRISDRVDNLLKRP